MCHCIIWYHALCFHEDPASTINIYCKDALQCNYDCSAQETMSLPLFGACPSCRIKATFAKNVPRNTQSFGFSPITESFEDEILVENDECCLSGTHSESSVNEIELFDRVTFWWTGLLIGCCIPIRTITPGSSLIVVGGNLLYYIENHRHTTSR